MFQLAVLIIVFVIFILGGMYAEQEQQIMQNSLPNHSEPTLKTINAVSDTKENVDSTKAMFSWLFKLLEAKS
jgi:hypothetical protein